MSSYLAKDNQQILWNTISNVPLFLNVFDGQSTTPNMLTDMTLKRGMLSKKTLDMEAGAAWFRNIVQKFYENNPNLPSTHLQQLNKTTISFMINDLKTMNTAQVNEAPPTFYESQTIVNGRKLDMGLVEKRQQEYENMFKKPVPPEIDFREKIPESSGGKVDDLLQQHIQKREAELKQYAPPILPPDQAMMQTREAVKKIPPMPENVTMTTQETDGEAAAPPANLDTILQLLKPVETREPRANEQLPPLNTDDNYLPVMRSEFKTLIDEIKNMATNLELLTKIMLRNAESSEKFEPPTHNKDDGHIAPSKDGDDEDKEEEKEGDELPEE